MSELKSQVILNVLKNTKKTNNEVIDRIKKTGDLPSIELMIRAFENNNIAIDIGIAATETLYDYDYEEEKYS